MKKKFEAYLMEVIKKYQKILLMDRYTFNVEYGVSRESAHMQCVFNYPYLNVVIRYSDAVMREWSEGKDISIYIVHEMIHPLTDGLYSKACERFVSRSEIEDSREELTDLICNIVLKGLKK